MTAAITIALGIILVALGVLNFPLRHDPPPTLRQGPNRKLRIADAIEGPESKRISQFNP